MYYKRLKTKACTFTNMYHWRDPLNRCDSEDNLFLHSSILNIAMYQNTVLCFEDIPVNKIVFEVRAWIIMEETD
jgi:hypothetical protein